jgi:hypothetical protein
VAEKAAALGVVERRLASFERTGERLKDEITRAVRRLLGADEISVDARGYVMPTA